MFNMRRIQGRLNPFPLSEPLFVKMPLRAFCKQSNDIKSLIEDFNIQAVAKKINYKAPSPQGTQEVKAPGKPEEKQVAEEPKKKSILSGFQNYEIWRNTRDYIGEYVVPMKSASPLIRKLIYQSYFQLVTSKCLLLSLPFCLKNGIDALSNPEAAFKVNDVLIFGPLSFHLKQNKSITSILF